MELKVEFVEKATRDMEASDGGRCQLIVVLDGVAGERVIDANATVDEALAQALQGDGTLDPEVGEPRT